MEFRRHVSRALHQDHAASLAILARLETLLGRHGAGRPPDAQSADTTRFLKDLVRAVDVEIGPHFAFEEEAVFPFLAANGDQEMGEYLIEEHRTILPLAERLVELAKLAREAGFTAEAWAEFHEIGASLVERFVSHIQKEDMGLLPALDEALDEETDGKLAIEFAARR
ncbi:MAG: hemerythrin domain-containing protein [Alphaproteobacteria bacterium]|nr:hemerythrin domain-containing protein [Alphaproteobacteria bacterium]